MVLPVGLLPALVPSRAPRMFTPPQTESAVDIHRHRERGVAELLLNVLRCLARLECELGLELVEPFLGLSLRDKIAPYIWTDIYGKRQKSCRHERQSSRYLPLGGGVRGYSVGTGPEAHRLVPLTAEPFIVERSKLLGFQGVGSATRQRRRSAISLRELSQSRAVATRLEQTFVGGRCSRDKMLLHPLFVV
jgi:hypothetical protein